MCDLQYLRVLERNFENTNSFVLFFSGHSIWPLDIFFVCFTLDEIGKKTAIKDNKIRLVCYDLGSLSGFETHK